MPPQRSFLSTDTQTSFVFTDTPVCMQLTVSTSVQEDPASQSPLPSPQAQAAPAISTPQSHTQTPPNAAARQQQSARPPARASAPGTPTHDNSSGDDATWGANFWVTLVDPQVRPNMCPFTLFSSRTEPNTLLRLPSDWPSQLGSARWHLCVRCSRSGHRHRLTLPTDFRPAKKANGGSSLTNRVEVCRIITRRKLGRQNGSAHPASLFLWVFSRYVVKFHHSFTLHALRSAISIPCTDHILPQNTAVGRRLSQTTFDHFSKLIPTQKVRTHLFSISPRVRLTYRATHLYK